MLQTSFRCKSPMYVFAAAHSLALAQTDDMQFSHNPSSHSQLDSQLTDSQDPDTDPHYHQSEEDSTMMHGDNDDLESEGYLDDRDELAQSEVQPPRKLLRLQTSGKTSLSPVSLIYNTQLICIMKPILK